MSPPVLIVSEQLNYTKPDGIHAIFMPVIIEFSTNHESLSQPIMKMGSGTLYKFLFSI